MNTNRVIGDPVVATEKVATYLSALPEVALDQKSIDEARAEFQHALSGRLRALRGTRTQSELAHLVGIHANTLGKYERGESAPDAFVLSMMLALMNDGLDGATTKGDIDLGPPTRSVRAVEYGNYLYVPHFDVSVSAGNGVFAGVESVTTMRPFEMGYIRNRLEIAHDELAMVNVVGDSMAPMLHNRDTVLVDRRDREVHIEGPHLLRLDGALYVKDLQRRPGRALRVSSRNAAYDSFDIRPDEDGNIPEDADFEVLGRVRWAAVTFD